MAFHGPHQGSGVFCGGERFMNVVDGHRVVVCAVLVEQGHVLLAKRADNKRIAPGKFHLPGGHVELGEDPADALKREIMEELGIQVQVLEPIHIFSYQWNGQNTVGIAYLVQRTDCEQPLRWDPNDIAACIWCAEDGLCVYFSSDDHNFDAARAGFARECIRESLVQRPGSSPVR